MALKIINPQHARARGLYSSNIMCQPVKIGSQRLLGFIVKYQIKIGNILMGNIIGHFFFVGLVFEKKATEHRLCSHAQISAHHVIFGKYHHLLVCIRVSLSHCQPAVVLSF